MYTVRSWTLFPGWFAEKPNQGYGLFPIRLAYEARCGLYQYPDKHSLSGLLFYGVSFLTYNCSLAPSKNALARASRGRRPRCDFDHHYRIRGQTCLVEASLQRWARTDFIQTDPDEGFSNFIFQFLWFATASPCKKKKRKLSGSK